MLGCMIEIVPSINVPTFQEVQERIAKVEPYVSWCHLDVTDGIFSKHPTWHDPADLSQLQAKLNVEVHLMIEKPEEAIGRWLVKPIKRVIVHLEAMSGPMCDTECLTMIKKCREAGKEIGFAIKSGTPMSLLDPWLAKADMILLLRVQPGASGQHMQSEMLEEIKHVRKSCPGCIIEIDGGVTVDNAKRAVETGANLLVAGSVIFLNQNIGEAIEALKRV